MKALNTRHYWKWLGLLSIVGSVHANAAQQLWTYNKNTHTTHTSHSKSNVYSRLSSGKSLTINLHNIAQAQIGKVFSANVDNKTHSLTLERVKLHANGAKTLVFRLENGMPWVVTQSKRSTFANINTDQGNYILAGSSSKAWLQSTKKTFEGITFGDDTKHYAHLNNQQLDEDHQPVLSRALSPTNIPQSSQKEQSTEIAVIDVMAAYTQSAEDLYDGDLDTRLNHIIEVTNQAYLDSNVYIRVELIGKHLLDIPSTTKMGTMLDDALATNYQLNNYESMREYQYQIGADVIMLIHPYQENDNLCGIAPLASPSPAPKASMRHSLVSGVYVDCPDDVFAHELGHNLGLAHSIKNPSSNQGSRYFYGRGYGIQDDFNTIMAYQSDYNSTGVLKFSNPEIECNGFTCGVEVTDTENGANAALAMNQMRFAAANQLHRNTQLTLLSSTLENTSETAFKDCSFYREGVVNPKYTEMVTKIGNCAGEKIQNIESLSVFPNLADLTLGSSLEEQSGNVWQAFAEHVPNLSYLQFWYFDFGNFENLVQNQNLYGLVIGPGEMSDLTELTKLPHLTNLDISYNQFTSIEQLKQMNNLRYLWLGGNPIEDVSPISYLTKLEGLSLFALNLTELPTLSPAIRSLSIQNNNLTDLTPISDLKDMFFLNFSNNSVDDISPLSEMNDNVYLLMSDNNVSDLSPISNMTELSELSAANNQITNLNPLKNLNNLTTIDLTGNSDITCVDVSEVLSSIDQLSGCFGPEDTDGDGIPNDEDSDDDNDGMPDSFEKQYGLNPLDASDASLDNDQDGLTNLEEYKKGTSPLDSDTDDDGIIDSEDPTPTGKTKVHHDYTGDGKADIAIRRASNFYQYIKDIDTNALIKHSFGKSTSDIPLAGDFDGDGKFDIAVRRPTNHHFYIKNSTDGDIQRINFGKDSNDIPVAADYDGDGKHDAAVRRPSNFYWYIKNSSNGEIQRIQFGKNSSDMPAPADYDGDGKADIAVYRASNQTWYIKNSSGSNYNSNQQDGIQRVVFGLNANDIPVPADYDADGKQDIAIYRSDEKTWEVLLSTTQNRMIAKVDFSGFSNIIPIPADYDGDGKADFAIRTSHNFTQHILRSFDWQQQTIVFGKQQSDIPINAYILSKMEMLNSQTNKLKFPHSVNTTRSRVAQLAVEYVPVH